MKIDVDICKNDALRDKGDFFISVAINDQECISFDSTIKGHRVIKQGLVGHKQLPSNANITLEWDTIKLDNQSLVGVEHIKWVDLDKKDWCNDEIWETVWEKPMSDELSNRLFHYSDLIQDNYKNLDKIKGELSKFEDLLKTEIVKY